MSQGTLPLDPPTHLRLRFACGHVLSIPALSLPSDLDWDAAKRAARMALCLLCREKEPRL
jgi:hypothetical protein